MKNKSTLLSLGFAVMASIALTNCSGTKKEEATTESTDHAAMEVKSDSTSASSSQFAVDAAFKKQLSDVFTAYITLKEAFVATDAAKVKTEATTTQAALTKVDMMLLSGPAHHDWMTYLNGMDASLKEITEATDIEKQRKAFSTLSDNLYKSIKAYGLAGTTAYYEFCPMAFDNKGAFWLSDNDKIRNPYFGDKMLSCGSVKETIQ